MSSDKLSGFMGNAIGDLSKATTGDNVYERPKPNKEAGSPKNKVSKPNTKKSDEPVHQKKTPPKRGTGSSKSKNDEPVLQYLPHSKITPWKYANRPEAEFGDMQELVQSIKTNGQEVPALVRAVGGGKFELIYGRRRWTACGDLDLDVLCMVKTLNDQEAFVAQALENDRRKDLSGYARAMDYRRALDAGIFKNPSALAANLNLDRTSVYSIMSFTKLPERLVKEIGDMSKVGIKTAKAIIRLLDQDAKFLEDLILKAEKIRDGSFAESAIKRLSESLAGNENKKPIVSDGKYSCESGNVFSVKTTSKGEVVLTILDDGRKLLDGDKTILEILEIFKKRSKKIKD